LPSEFGLERVQNFVGIATNRFTPHCPLCAARDFFCPPSFHFFWWESVLRFIETAKQLSSDIGALINRQAEGFFQNFSRVATHSTRIPPASGRVDRITSSR
jgi:hypothetical protein